MKMDAGSDLDLHLLDAIQMLGWPLLSTIDAASNANAQYVFPPFRRVFPPFRKSLPAETPAVLDS